MSSSNNTIEPPASERVPSALCDDEVQTKPAIGSEACDSCVKGDDGSEKNFQLLLDPEKDREGAMPLGAEPEHNSATATAADQFDNLVDAQWLETQFSELTAAVASGTKHFDVVMAQSKRIHEINAELHTELQSLRGNALLEMMRPGFSGFVRLIGQLDSDIERLRDVDEVICQTLRAYRINLANALQDCGLTEDPPTPLDDLVPFSPNLQEINAVVLTVEPTKNQKIARIALPGFSFGGKRLFRERVDVYRYTASALGEKDQ